MLRMPPLPCLALGRGNLLERAADVHRCRARARLGRPRNRPAECPIDLEHTHAIPVLLQAAAVRGWQAVARNPQERTGREVAEDCARGREIVERCHWSVGDDLSAKRAQVRDERIREALGAAARKHPSGKMRRGAEHQPESGGDGVLERQHAMGCEAREQRARGGIGERARGEPVRRPDRVTSEPRERERVPRPSGGPSTASSRWAQWATVGPISCA